MKTFTSLSAFALLASVAYAFPSFMFDIAEREARSIEDISAEFMTAVKEKRGTPGFDAAAQRIDVSGAHAFVPPGPNDQRGPCPGLNALANHNYIPHNGDGKIQDYITATNKVFGMGLDLSTFLSTYGALMDGDLLSWSIGRSVPGKIGNGLIGSHNKYEGDASPTRGDLYQYGDDYKVVLRQWIDLINSQPDDDTANYDIPVLTKFRHVRFQQQIANNPYFFNGPVTGVIVLPAAYTFIYRFMANHTAEFPAGVLKQEVLKSFFSITGSRESGWAYNPGNERIPENWYRRAIGDEYTIPYYLTDVVAAATQYPEFLSIGGNTGKVNTFTGVDLSKLTKGVYNSKTLLQGNNAACFAFQAIGHIKPDILLGLPLDNVGVGSKLTALVSPFLSSWGCPQLKEVDASQLSQYPGYTRSVSGTKLS